MNHPRASSFGCFLLLALFPLCASAAPKDPCKLLQRDLDQQIDDLKAWQKLDLQECYKVSGSDSDACRRVQDRHAQDLRSFRDDRAYQMANCRGNRTRSAVASSIENSNSDSYDSYYSNHGKCVPYPYVDCSHFDRYVHNKLHHHHDHYYSDPRYGAAKSASASAGKPSKNEAPEYADKGTKQNAAAHRSVPGSPAESAHRSSDRDTTSNHGSGHGDSSPKAASNHSHDRESASNSGSHSSSGGSHASGGSSSSAGSSSGAHSSGGSGSSSSGSSSSGAGHSSSASSGNSAASASSAASPASSPSHDSGGSRPH
jgi:hypothetical protein